MTSNSGGLEMLFSNKRKYQLSVPSKDDEGRAANLAFLVRFLCKHLMKYHRQELFVVEGAV